MLKELLAALQTEVLSEDTNSDCGTKMFLHKKITSKNLKDNLYRYIKGPNGELIQLNAENGKSYIGKNVEMRSIMYCTGCGKEKYICEKCAGDFYYKLGKLNIGLNASKLAGTLSNLNLQKFHDNVVKLHPIDVDDMLI